MIIQDWSVVLKSTLITIWQAVAAFLPKLVIAVVIFIIGWIVATIVGKLIAQIIRPLNIESVLKGLKVEEALEHAGLKLNVGGFVGGLVKWFFIVVFLVASLDVLGLQQVNDFLREDVLGFLPNLIIAVLILLVAAVIGDAMQRIITASARAANFRTASLLGAVTKWAIWVFAIFSALQHLKVELIGPLFNSIMIALAIGFGLAFGLGGQDAAAKFIDRVKQEMSEKAK